MQGISDFDDFNHDIPPFIPPTEYIYTIFNDIPATIFIISSIISVFAKIINL